MSPVNPDDYDEVVRRINKKYEGDIRQGNEMDNPSRISTGSLELDVAMGGGIPVGRWTRFYGGYSSTKTLRALSCAREAQKLGMSVAYYNVEKSYHPDFVRDKIGVDIDKLMVVEGTSIEGIGEKMESLLGVVHMHIIDSCTLATSDDELEADIRDWRPGISARAWGKAIRRLNDRFDSNENTVILIDQARVQFGQQGGEQAAGGRILDHQSSMTVYFKKGGWLYRNADGELDEKAKVEKGISGAAQPSGIEIKARVEKSRVCRPFRSATMRFDLDNLHFDPLFELVKAAKYYGVVDTTSPGRYEYQGHKMHGDKALREFIAQQKDLAELIRTTAIQASL